MPLTFPSHAAIVLPLKLWRPGWFDGVALVLGSTTPDLPYALHGVYESPSAHNLPAVALWCVPATLVGCRLARWAAPAVAAQLPGWGRDLGVLGAVRHRWWITVLSAVIGALSHLGWDGFTHDPAGGHAWAVRRLPVLEWTPVGGTPLWWLLQQASTVVGAAVTLWLVVVIGRRGLLRAWHGPPAPARPDRVAFWGAALGVGGLLVLVSVLLPLAWFSAIIGVRVLVSGAVGLLAGAWVVRQRGVTL